MELAYGSILYAIVILVIYLCFKKGNGIFPPGPRGLPFLGHLLAFGEKSVQQMQQIHAKYGKTLHLKMGSQDIVVCADMDLLKQHFRQDAFLARPSYSVLNAFTDPGFLMYNGEEWRAAKRFFLKSLKSLGFGRTGSEKHIHTEVEHFLEAIENERKHGPIKIAKYTGPAASNVIGLFVTGQRLDYEDQTRKLLDSIFLRPLDGEDVRPAYLSFLNFTPLARMLKMLPAVNFTRKLQQVSKDYLEKRVQKVASTYNLIDEPNNLIEFFLKERQENPDDSQFFDGSQLINNGYAFFVAGSATTQEYLEWWFMLMADHPQVQEKMRAEVDSVLGSERAALADRSKMPYTEAVIHEVHRYASLVALNLPHVAEEDSQFGPYLLPKGTQVIINMHAIHHDPDYFPDPDQFKPERFLSENGSKFIRSDKLIPFGMGKRSCAGESLAQAEIFLFTVSTLQKFILKAPMKFDGEIYSSLFSNLPKKAVQINFEAR